MSRNYWDRWLAQVSEEEDRIDMPFLKELLQRGIAEILDVGSGNGRSIRKLARLGFRVTCVDYSSQAIQYLQYVSQDPFIKHMNVVCGNLLSLPFHDKSFGAVISLNAMNFFIDESEREKAFKEIFRVVKPGGVMLFAVISIEDDGAKLGLPLGNGNFQLPDGIRLHYYTPSELEKTMEGKIYQLTCLEFEDKSHQSSHIHASIRILAFREE